jgi:hypothetical protein
MVATFSLFGNRISFKAKMSRACVKLVKVMALVRSSIVLVKRGMEFVAEEDCARILVRAEEAFNGELESAGRRVIAL